MFRATHRPSSGARNCNSSLWFYIRLWLPVAAMARPSQRLATINVCKTRGWNYNFLSSWWWAVCRPKHVEQLRNIGIINSTTQSHLIGFFYEIYITMHGFLNIKSNQLLGSRLDISDSSKKPLLTTAGLRDWWPVYSAENEIYPGFETDFTERKRENEKNNRRVEVDSKRK